MTAYQRGKCYSCVNRNVPKKFPNLFLFLKLSNSSDQFLKIFKSLLIEMVTFIGLFIDKSKFLRIRYSAKGFYRFYCRDCIMFITINSCLLLLNPILFQICFSRHKNLIINKFASRNMKMIKTCK